MDFKISIRNILQFAVFSTTANRPPIATLVRWGACEEPIINTTPATVGCATLSVPIDYTELQSNQRLDLELLRVPAPYQPSRESIQVKFSGPGSTGRENFALLVPYLLP